MAGQQYLTALSENATRFGMRLSETLSEHTRELALARGGVVGSGAAYLDATDDKTKNIKKQLESSSDREKLDAMKRLVALISKGRNASEYFASVVKNVASPNLEIRKLVYIYLLKYAEHEPDLALLSINTFQRDLGDPSPLIRGMALRVLSGIKVPMVGSVVVLAIKKCAADMSAYVRKCAALAVPKCYQLDEAHLPALIEVITILLQDRSPLSLGATAHAFEAICPTRLDLVHPHFRRLCKILVDVDEWGQVTLVGLLLRYARVMLPQPIIEGEDEKEVEVDKDLKLLLDSVKLLFMSRNPAVVVAVTKVLFYAGPPSYWPTFVNPLMRQLTISKEAERVVLVDLLIITKKVPHLFTPHYSRFLVRSDDFTSTKKDKIRLLLNLLTLDNYGPIMREFIDCAEDTEDSVVTVAVEALGQCATRIPECMPQCLSALITMIKSRYDTVVNSAVVVLKNLVQMQLATTASPSFASTSASPQSPMSIIAHLARRIDDIRHAQARACVVWLVGQYAGSEISGSASTSTPGTSYGLANGTPPEGLAEWSPDVLRKLAKSFSSEAHIVKTQVVTLAGKLYVLSPHDKRIGLLAKYVFNQARYDLNYDVRDRGRMVSSLLAGVGGAVAIGGSGGDDDGDEGRLERGGVVLRREQVRLVLFEGKAVSVGTFHEFFDDERILVGSLARVTGTRMGDDILPDWLEKGVESTLRDSKYDAPPPAPVPTALGSSGAKSFNGGGSKGGSSGLAPSPIVLTPTGVGSRPDSRNGTSARGPWTDLDSFYADEEEEEEESSEEEEEGESEVGEEQDEAEESEEESEESSEEEDNERRAMMA